jgi:hypothetical protein
MHEQMRLDNCGGGALADLFDEALPKILADIRDPKKVTEQARKLVLTIEFRVKDEDPTAPIELLVGSKLTLAKRKQRQSFAAITHDGKMVQHLVAQGGLFASTEEEEPEEQDQEYDEQAPEEQGPLGVINGGTTEGDHDAE